MKSRLMVAMSMLAISTGISSDALAQSDPEGYVVMRRVISTMEDKAPAGPGSEPTTRVATSLGNPGAGGNNSYAKNGFVRLSINALGCADSSGKIFEAANCTNQGSISIGDMVQLPAKMGKSARTVYLSKSDIKNAAQYLDEESVDNACDMSITIDGGPWTTSCDTPNIDYNEWRAYSLVEDSSQGIDGGTLKLKTGSMTCRNIQTGEAGSGCDENSDGQQTGSTVEIPATFVGEMDMVFIDEDEIREITQDEVVILGRARGQICSSITRARTSQGTWTVRCGEAENPANYSRYPIRALDPSDEGPSAGRNSYNLSSSANSVQLVITGTGCIDLRTQTAPESIICESLKNGANIYDIVNIPAVFVKDLRKIYVERSAMESILPEGATSLSLFNSKSINQVCQGEALLKVAPDTPGARNTWKVSCDEPDSGDNYVSMINELRDPYANGGATRLINQVTRDTYTFDIALTACIHMSGAVVDRDNCTYKPGALISTGYRTVAPEGVSIKEISVRYDNNTREAFFSRDEINALGQYVSIYGRSSGGSSSTRRVAALDFCNTTGYIYAAQNTFSALSYRVRCE